jgi:hypothetical protein
VFNYFIKIYRLHMSGSDDLPAGLDRPPVLISDFEVGSFVRCRTSWDEIVEGFVYAVDSGENRIILENANDLSGLITP